MKVFELCSLLSAAKSQQASANIPQNLATFMHRHVTVSQYKFLCKGQQRILKKFQSQCFTKSQNLSAVLLIPMTFVIVCK